MPRPKYSLRYEPDKANKGFPVLVNTQGIPELLLDKLRKKFQELTNNQSLKPGLTFDLEEVPAGEPYRFTIVSGPENGDFRMSPYVIESCDVASSSVSSDAKAVMVGSGPRPIHQIDTSNNLRQNGDHTGEMKLDWRDGFLAELDGRIQRSTNDERVALELLRAELRSVREGGPTNLATALLRSFANSVACECGDSEATKRHLFIAASEAVKSSDTNKQFDKGGSAGRPGLVSSMLGFWGSK